jgi:hypothetical protein
MSTLPRCLIPLMAAWIAVPALADEVSGASERDLLYEDRIAELERTVKVLAEELERTRADVTVPEDQELTSAYGLGPAASKVYGLTRGLSVGGYGEAFYRNYVSDVTTEKDSADFLRAVLYFGYKFTDRILFNSEIEIEHANEISLEFATLDFFWKDWLNTRAGLLLVPVGFLNEIHEPPFFYGVNRPDVERFIIPTTWRENGAGLFGSFGEQLRYKLYVTDGFDATGFDASGLRGGRQKGSKALAEQLAFTGRLDWLPTPEFLIGASFFTGESGQNQVIGDTSIPDARTTLFDVHTQYAWRGLHLRGLFTMAFVDDAGDLSLALRDTEDLGDGEAIADAMLGGYAEIAYEVMQWIAEGGERSLEPFYRYEWYDTQWDMPSGFAADESKRIQVHTVGLQFKPTPNVVLKADYRNRDAKQGKIADEFNLGVGYVF